jgi:DNA-binding MarR family transcriptional regulator
LAKGTETIALERFTRAMFTRTITGLSRTLREQQLTVPQLAALFLLDERSPQTLSTVAQAVGLSLSACSRMLNGLARDGLIERTESAHDRRQKQLALTAAGSRLIERAGAERVRLVNEVAAELPPTVARLMMQALATQLRRGKSP